MRFAWLARKLDTGPALAPPQQPRVFALEAPPPTAFLVGHKPFMVVDDEQGVAFGLVDLKRVDGEVVIDTFTYISPPDADVTDRFPPPARFRKYRIQGPRVLLIDRNEQIEARIELIPWRVTSANGDPNA